MAGGIKIPVSTEFDDGDINKAVSDFTTKINRLGTAVAQANKLKFNPVDRAAHDDMRKLEQQFQSLLKINASLRQRMRATGQEGQSFQSVDWNRVYADSSQRGRAVRQAFDYVTAGTGLSGRLSGPPAQPGAPAPPVRPGGGGGGGGGYPGQGIVNAGLGASGPVGGVVAGALGSGASGGFMAGLGGLFGGLAALGVGKLVGGIRDKLGSAEQEAIGYDSLKRTLGDVNVQFEYLRGSLRQTGDSLGMTYAESLKLGTEFAKLAGMTSDQYKTLAGEVRIGGGLSRSFGVDPSRGNSFMATMRLAGATGSESDSRRVALLIGEAVGKVGFSKADEVLQAVSSFAMNAARTSMSAGNVAGYAASLASLAGSGRPGLDAAGSAALLGRINSSVEGGGSYGEAGQNFMLAAIGRPLGLSPIRTKMQLQKGAFGMGKNGQSNIQMIMAGLRQQYGGLPKEFMFNAGANLLGINESQFEAFAEYGRGGALNGIEGRLKRGGIAMSSLNPTAFGALARINGGSLSDLKAQADNLMGLTGRDALSGSERERLKSAMAGGNVESMKDVLVELTATRDQEMTEGKATRDSINAVDNTMTRLATVLIPATNTMRDALVAMASVIAPDSQFGKAAKDVAQIRERDKAVAEFDDKLSAYDKETATRRAELVNQPGFNPQRYDEMRALGRRRLETQRGLQLGHLGAGPQGVSDALLSALIQQESGGRHLGDDGRLLRNDRSGALGITQVMPDTGKNPGFGVQPLQNDSREEYIRFGRDYLGAMMRRYGGDKSRSLAAFNWGPGNVDAAIAQNGTEWLSSAPAETQKYVDGILKNEGMYSGVIPGFSPGAGAGRGRGPTQAEVDVLFNIKDKSGSTLAPSVSTRVKVPAPAGAQ